MKYLVLIFLLVSCVDCNEDNGVVEASSQFNKICIEGNVYYKAKSGHKGFLAIKMNNLGNPVVCPNKKEIK